MNIQSERGKALKKKLLALNEICRQLDDQVLVFKDEPEAAILLYQCLKSVQSIGRSVAADISQVLHEAISSATAISKLTQNDFDEIIHQFMTAKDE